MEAEEQMSMYLRNSNESQTNVDLTYLVLQAE
jgi:hypothetical protein